jgi:hypothetical protein
MVTIYQNDRKGSESPGKGVINSDEKDRIIAAFSKSYKKRRKAK